ncbi:MULTISPECIES: holo-ACP synthase [unclassified Actinomyces]|uniref:holo-ACP synthase n=1 Tax=unclassified Actinomyces TaxID=2609248 RepID=UPI002017BC0B|nr:MULTISPECIES: holo-ACP synthase [unclassified Actinomyces]MCL3778722.1 holo-ACP synthase [Actinomyces sp. AC-20-1]MCL3790897.1 holo-ACP synthase [Actinomyces sp. 187325]MCL3791230.1 holo-ACP synthase [Actinomyces sp. 186855]MCL3793733.1 holo-ACP synthase [Actinomyces sp. 217892]
MLIAVGTDLVDVARLEDRLKRSPALARRLLTQREHRAARADSLAARVAAKEAVLKALGSALDAAGREVPDGWRMTDVEVVSDPGSPPRLALSGVSARTARELGVTRWHLSLSHDAGLALAFVVAEGS